jgi:hypothetical protein
MRTFKPVFLKLFAVAAFLWICSCNYAQTYTPEFNGKQAAVLDSINSKYSFEDVEIRGKKTSGTSGDHSILVIRFVNGKNLPTDDDKIVALAKQLAQQVKSTLKNPKEIESYTVYFDTKTVDGSTTTTHTSGREFKPGEI